MRWPSREYRVDSWRGSGTHWSFLLRTIYHRLSPPNYAALVLPRSQPEGSFQCLVNPGFAQHLRDARTECGRSVTEVAERWGARNASIYFWETDRFRPRDITREILAKKTGIRRLSSRPIASAMPGAILGSAEVVSAQE
jgi:hypothetical protein